LRSRTAKRRDGVRLAVGVQVSAAAPEHLPRVDYSAGGALGMTQMLTSPKHIEWGSIIHSPAASEQASVLPQLSFMTWANRVSGAATFSPFNRSVTSLKVPLLLLTIR
jgi:hypothetical protein